MQDPEPDQPTQLSAAVVGQSGHEIKAVQPKFNRTEHPPLRTGSDADLAVCEGHPLRSLSKSSTTTGRSLHAQTNSLLSFHHPYVGTSCLCFIESVTTERILMLQRAGLYEVRHTSG